MKRMLYVNDVVWSVEMMITSLIPYVMQKYIKIHHHQSSERERQVYSIMIYDPLHHTLSYVILARSYRRDMIYCHVCLRGTIHANGVY